MNAWAVIGLVWIGAALALGLIVGKVIARGESTDWDALAKLMKSAAIRERVELRALTFEPAEVGRREKGAGPGGSSEGLWFPPVPPRGRAGD